MRSFTLKITLLVVGMCILNSPAFSQSKNQEKQLAYTHISALKSSALLVRLKTKQKTIDALRKNNLNQEADIVTLEMRQKNLAIIKAFNEKFNFCPVYFFYSSDSKLVLENKLDSVRFLNEKLEYDGLIKFNSDNFYIGEFGNIEQHPSTSKTGDYDTYDSEGNIITREAYNGQTNFGFGALVIKDSNFNQLLRPFPYYSRTYQDIIFIKRKYSTVVSKMNEKLREYLKSPN